MIVSGIAGAFNVIITDPNVTHRAAAGSFVTQLDPDTHQHLPAGATEDIRKLYDLDYPNFTYVEAPANRKGALTISQLDVFQDGSQGGLDIVASFAGAKAHHIYRWIQYIEMNPIAPAFLGAARSPFTDPPPLKRDDTLPFYETDIERNKEGKGYLEKGSLKDNPRFWDRPIVNDSRAPVKFHLNLFLTDEDRGNHTVTIYDGIRYGFQITPIPEPEAWAMMILGLGLIGWRLRRNKNWTT
jgi:hypothetical protein